MEQVTILQLLLKQLVWAAVAERGSVGQEAADSWAHRLSSSGGSVLLWYSDFSGAFQLRLIITEGGEAHLMGSLRTLFIKQLETRYQNIYERAKYEWWNIPAIIKESV